MVQLEARDALARVGAAAAVPLAVEMRTGHYGVLHHAEELFTVLGPDVAAAAPVLAELCAHRDSNVREIAARALGEIGPGAVPAAPALLDAIRDIRIAVRSRAAVALGRVGRVGREAAPLLLDALGDGDARVRASAAFALGWILGQEALHAADERLLEGSREPQGCRRASLRPLQLRPAQPDAQGHASDGSGRLGTVLDGL